MCHDAVTKKERQQDTTRLPDRGSCGEGVSFIPRCPLPNQSKLSGKSGSSHGGLHLVVVLGMVRKPVCLLAFFRVWGPSAIVQPFFHPLSLSLESWMIPALALARGWLGWGKQKHGLSQAVPRASLGTRNSCRPTSPGEGRGEAEWMSQSWAAEGATCG